MAKSKFVKEVVADGYTWTVRVDGSLCDVQPKPVGRVSIPEGVVDVCMRYSDDEWFWTKASVLRLPKSFKNRSDSSDVYGANLTDIEVAPGNRKLKSVDGVLYSKDGKRLISWPTKKPFTGIPEGVEEILGYAFYGCSMTEIVLPKSLRVLSDSAFVRCSKLRRIVRQSRLTLPSEPSWANLICEMSDSPNQRKTGKKKFQVIWHRSYRCSKIVEAESEEEALDLVQETDVPDEKYYVGTGSWMAVDATNGITTREGFVIG